MLTVPMAVTFLVPKSVTALRSYSWDKFAKDLVAGVTVGLVALPLAMAFAISSGVPPQSGLYCAVLAGFVISALGGSMVQVGGPTGAFVVVVSGILHKHGMDGLFMCTLMAGVLLVLLGVTGLGSAIRFIPRPVVIGFTNGIAVLIASTQVKDFFGLQLAQVPGEFLPRMQAVASRFSTLSLTATALSVGCLAVIVSLLVFYRRVPGTIVALLAGTALAALLHLPVETIGTKFGGIPGGLPQMHMPTFRPDLIPVLLSPALTVMMLGAIESLLSAVVADRLSGDKHDSNMELVAQGVANIVSPLFGGLPATGAIARTATNVRSGAQTPVAGMVHALTVLGVILFAAPLAKQIPLAVLAAILMVVSYMMGEWKEIPDILRSSRSDAAVWLITFVLTVFADLTVAVEAGMILAALLYIQKVTSTTTVAKVTDSYIEHGRKHSLQAIPLPEGVEVYRIHGPFLFGATDKLTALESEVPQMPPVVMLRLRNMTALDSSGVHALENFVKKVQASGRTVVTCGVRQQPEKLLRRSRFAQLVGEENFLPDLESAAERARAVLGVADGDGSG